MPQNLDQIGAATAEDEQMTADRVDQLRLLTHTARIMDETQRVSRNS